MIPIIEKYSSHYSKMISFKNPNLESYFDFYDVIISDIYFGKLNVESSEDI